MSESKRRQEAYARFLEQRKEEVAAYARAHAGIQAYHEASHHENFSDVYREVYDRAYTALFAERWGVGCESVEP